MVKAHGFEYGSTPPDTIGTFLPLKGCNAVEVKRESLASLGSGEMLGDHELTVSNPSGKDALALLLVFSQPITLAEAVVRRKDTRVKIGTVPTRFKS